MKHNFEAGQEVARIFHHWDRHVDCFCRIDRVTATLAIVGSMKFNRETGKEYGNRYGSYSIEPATPELHAEYELQQRREARLEFLRKFLDGNWRSMGEENLEKIATALGFGDTQRVESREK